MFGPTEELQNHPGEQKLADGQQLFVFATGCFQLFLRIMGCIWALYVKRFGSVGTRVYYPDALFAFCGLLAMFHGTRGPDQQLFFVAMFAHVALLINHFLCTRRNKEHHVHSQCLGDSRLG
ncbi:MAG: hypothetical protein AAFX06_14145, partial [Planctomycetota bacterium]